jgi:hypothetical protein
MKAKLAYLCTSGLRNTLLVKLCILRETIVSLPETVLKIVFWNTK